MLLESGCIIAGLEQRMEIGRTEIEWVIYCKSKTMSIADLTESVAVSLSRYGLMPFVINKKEDPSGNVILIEIQAI